MDSGVRGLFRKAWPLPLASVLKCFSYVFLWLLQSLRPYPESSICLGRVLFRMRDPSPFCVRVPGFPSPCWSVFWCQIAPVCFFFSIPLSKIRQRQRAYFYVICELAGITSANGLRKCTNSPCQRAPKGSRIPIRLCLLAVVSIFTTLCCQMINRLGEL